MEDPCKNCPNIQLDSYGYVCDLACGKRTAWLNYQAGVKDEKAKVRVIYKDANDLKELEDRIREYLDVSMTAIGRMFCLSVNELAK